MSDVWRELEERLKQKVKTAYEVHSIGVNEYFNKIREAKTKEEKEKHRKRWMQYIDNKQWVRLEDVLNTLQEIKKEYTLAEKQKLLLIKGILEKVAFKRKVEQLWVIPEKSKPYDNSPEGWYPACIVPEFLTDRKLVIMMDEYYQELMKTLEELLRKNEG